MRRISVVELTEYLTRKHEPPTFVVVSVSDRLGPSSVFLLRSLKSTLIVPLRRLKLQLLVEEGTGEFLCYTSSCPLIYDLL